MRDIPYPPLTLEKAGKQENPVMREPWKLTINIKDLLSDDTSKEAVVAACTGICARLSHLRHDYKYDGLILDICLEQLEDIATGSQDADDFNCVLSDLYDWADHSRVWLGL